MSFWMRVRCRPSGKLSQQFFNNVPMDVGKPEITTLESIGQSFVVQAQQVK